ncbi:auxin efflux carrier component 2 [Amborella trichopoda]|uniref:auxin efflux carrier component 2 n=1 Tax=Amborella trichopoda TaxID=13333 RepID=UPI0009BFEBE6|nr:auxin efflux carrier component 2 [Amborella trichopoda]|eukprot:XP_011626547.2 auxin efflux carrier component 2 [Amborella trichopoda]
MMISMAGFYEILSTMVPLYLAMLLAFASVKWWRMFSDEQCSGINKFVANFAAPLLSFKIIYSNDPYKMNHKLILADTMQKLLILFALMLWVKLTKRGSFDWMITLFSMSTLPNTVILGIPLLRAMYGEESEQILFQIVVLQFVVWYPFLLFLYELREAKGAVGRRVSTAVINGSTVVLEVEARSETRMSSLSLATVDGQGSTTAMNGSVVLVVEASAKENSLGYLNGEEGTANSKEREVQVEAAPPQMRMINLLILVWSKVIKNPNTYSSILGLVWGLISFRFNIRMPKIVDKSVTILSVTGLGLSMFSLGLFMASQPNLMPCGKRNATIAMFVRFSFSVVVMSMCSILLGLQGNLLKVAIVQAALPQGVITFVFAEEYKAHEDILSTAVCFGTLISLPITLAYYFLLSVFHA